MRSGGLGWRVWTALGVLYFVWGSTFLGTKIAVATAPPLVAGGCRFLLAGALLSAFAVLRGAQRPSSLQARGAAIAGVLLITGGNGAVMLAETRLGAGQAGLLNALSPLLMVAIGTLAYRESVGRLVWAGLLLGLGGVAFLVAPAGGGIHYDPAGATFSLTAALCWAAGAVYGSRSHTPAHPGLASGIQMLAGGLGMLVLGVLMGEATPAALSHVSPASLEALAYLVVVGSLVGFSSFSWLIRKAPLSLVSTHNYVNPVVAVVLGALLLGERVDVREVVGGAVIITAVVIIVSFRPRATPEPEPEPDTEATAAAHT